MAGERDISRLADDLLGTCQSLSYACETSGYREDDLTQNELMELDERVMECVECNWWVDSDEINEDGLCLECAE